MSLHGSCVALDEDGVLLLGPSGSGKSDLVLRLLGQGWTLVADDQVRVEAVDAALHASAPDPLRGMLEIRGLGLVGGLPTRDRVRLRLAARLVEPGAPLPRLPEAAAFEALGILLPRIDLRGLEASAPDKLALALSVIRGRASMPAGALAAAPLADPALPAAMERRRQGSPNP